jgi:hypothetical protein
LRAGQDAAGVAGHDRAQDGARQAENRLGDAGVVAHLEGAGDVVDQLALAGGDRGDPGADHDARVGAAYGSCLALP